MQDTTGSNPAPQQPEPPKDVALAELIRSDYFLNQYRYHPRKGWHERPRDPETTVPTGPWQSTTQAAVIRSASYGRHPARVVRDALYLAQGTCLVPHGKWDADPCVAGLPNGQVVDLRTAAVRDAGANEYISRTLGAVPDMANPTPPRWLRFLGETLPPDSADFVCRWLGSALVGRADRSESFCVLHGPTGTGKTTLLETMVRALGGYHQGIPANALAATSAQAGHMAWLAKLDGARFATCSELPERSRWNQDQLKRLVSGETQTANLMRQNPYTFRPVATVALAANTLPSMQEDGGALRRRIRVVPLANRPAAPDADLGQALARELPQILGWLVLHAAQYLAHGHQPVPHGVNRASDDYADDHDQIGAFLEAMRITPAPGAVAPSADMIRLYNDFAEPRRPWKTVKPIREELERRGYRYGVHNVNGNSVRGFAGLHIP